MAGALCVVGADRSTQHYVTRVVAQVLGSTLTAVLVVRYVKRESTLCLVAQAASVQINGTHSVRPV